MDELTVANFVSKIKAMDSRERLKKLDLKKLIELICSIPDDENIVAAQLADLKATVENINKTSAVNSNEILALKAQNEEIVKKNAAMRIEIDLLKVHAQECVEKEQNRDRNRPPPPSPALNDIDNLSAIKDLQKEIVAIQDEINNIQQYLRVNNLEIVGLPVPNEGESEETLLLNALNNLEGIDNPIRHEDIDISHPLNSNRKDGKPVHIVRFLSRKTKNMVLTAKKQEDNKQYKFRNKDIYINEHLSKQNRALFAAAQERKKNLNYKYCWTRSGVINMRKTDNSQIITISGTEDLTNLVQ